MGNAGEENESPDSAGNEGEGVTVDEENGEDEKGTRNGRYIKKGERWAAPLADKVPSGVHKRRRDDESGRDERHK